MPEITAADAGCRLEMAQGFGKAPSGAAAVVTVCSRARLQSRDAAATAPRMIEILDEEEDRRPVVEHRHEKDEPEATARGYWWRAVYTGIPDIRQISLSLFCQILVLTLRPARCCQPNDRGGAESLWAAWPLTCSAICPGQLWEYRHEGCQPVASSGTGGRRSSHPWSRMHCRRMEAALPLPDPSDAVLALDVLEHLDDDTAGLQRPLGSAW